MRSHYEIIAFVGERHDGSWSFGFIQQGLNGPQRWILGRRPNCEEAEAELECFDRRSPRYGDR